MHRFVFSLPPSLILFPLSLILVSLGLYPPVQFRHISFCLRLCFLRNPRFKRECVCKTQKCVSHSFGSCNYYNPLLRFYYVCSFSSCVQYYCKYNFLLFSWVFQWDTFKRMAMKLLIHNHFVQGCKHFILSLMH